LRRDLAGRRWPGPRSAIDITAVADRGVAVSEERVLSVVTPFTRR
jgi:hypothetical protein